MRLTRREIEGRGWSVVAERDGYVLYQVDEQEVWSNFYLRDWGRRRGKRVWRLAHNGERFANSDDFQALTDWQRDFVDEAIMEAAL